MIPLSPGEPLPVDAVRHLAHEMRGALHTILGHSELVGVEARDDNTRESATHIHASAVKLAAWVDDVVDLLRLPAVPDRGEATLALGSLLEAVSAAAVARGAHVSLEEPGNEPDAIVVDRAVARVVGRVLETVVATGKTDVRVRRAPFRAGDAVAVVSVTPVPVQTVADENGVMAIAERLFAARGGRIERTGETLRIDVPTRQLSAS